MINHDELQSGLVAAVAKYDSVRCDKCAFIVRMNDKRKASYFTNGWPLCCGETMRLHRLAPASTTEGS